MPRALLVAVLAAGVAAPLVCAGPAAHAATAVAKPWDFNGDGRQELVASAPHLRVDSIESAGGVVVLPATRDGLSLKGRLLTQSTPGILYEPEEGGTFGSGLASADFNRDGYADLVIATPDYIGYGELTELVTVIPGSAHGLEPAKAAQIRGSGGSDDSPGALGDAMVAADLTGDGYPDLAVEGSLANQVSIFPGGPRGLSAVPVRVLRGKGSGGGSQDADEFFGTSLGAGDLNGDGRIDLVVGAEGGNGTYAGTYPGSVSVCPGAAGGPTGCTRLTHSAAYAGPTSFAVGRVTGAAHPDLVVGVPQPTKDAVGSVRILQLKATGGIAVARTFVLTQAGPGVPGVDEAADAFGSALGLADLDSDGYADLLVGAPGENHGRGRVTIVHGARGGWRSHGNSTLDQSTKGVPGKAEVGDRFGSSLTLLDHDGDGHPDLAVGAPGENGSGAVTTLRGSGSGFTTAGSRTFGLKTLGIGDGAGAVFGDPLGS